MLRLGGPTRGAGVSAADTGTGEGAILILMGIRVTSFLILNRNKNIATLYVII